MAFVHLHNHTVFSMLDGATRIQDMVNRAVELGMPAVAITDHGYMYGVPDLALACDAVNHNTPEYKTWSHDKAFLEKDRRDELVEPDPEANPREHAQYVKDMAMWDEKGNIDELKPPLVIKPIFGCEVYFTPDETLARDHKPELYHMILLAKDQEGYVNLMQTVSEAAVQGFYYKPRVTLDNLRRHAKGMICTSACIAGIIPKYIDRGDMEGAIKWAETFRDTFEPGDFYIEIQEHGITTDNGLTDEQMDRTLIDIAKQVGVKVIATNDFHYLRREDAPVQDVIMCIGMNAKVDDPNRMRMTGSEFYMKTEEEMRAMFPYCPEACDNTLEIADKCYVELDWDSIILPRFPLLDPGETHESQFRRECEKGLRQHYGDDWATREIGGVNIKERFEYEYKVICDKGFAAYFLIVAEYVQWAKDNGIGVGPGRGSAAGAIVAYAMNITAFDPLENGLMFERFLSPQRTEMPDIDMDFGDTRRAEVVDYVRRKYGEDHVAQIVTFGTMAARGSIRDVGRVMNFTYAETDAVAKLVPPTPHMTLADALKQSPQLRQMYDSDERVRELVDTAKAIEGMPRNTSTHAAGVVITKLPVYDYVPLATNDGTIVTEYTMTTLEELGLLKMDFLGLRNITVIDDAIRDIRKTEPDFSMARVTDNDPKVMDMLTQGRTAGVFQMESTGMTGVCMGLKPQSIEDLSIIVAAYRPGPMESIPRLIACKQDPSLVKYKHPMLQPILSVTYGCILYQEQVIEIFRKLAGYSLGQADMVRRAMSKKKVKDIEKERGAFIRGDASRNISGCVANGIPEDVAASIYNEMYDFANYAFNKAHSVCYAVIAYQTAWFKCYYPREYMAALMTSVLDSSVKISEYIAECRAMDIALLPPDINESNDNFTVVPGGIRFGLAAIKNIGRGFILKVMDEREQHGKFTSLEDFTLRMYGTDLNKRALENLIKAGACDGFGLNRAQMLRMYELIMDAAANQKSKNVEGQMGLFDLLSGEDAPAAMPAIPVPNIPELSAQEKMSLEKQTTGLYLSGHPMDDYRPLLRGMDVVPIGEILECFENGEDTYQDEQIVNIAGIVEAVKMKTTKSGSMMAYVTVEDSTGAMEMLVFSGVLGQYGSMLYENSAVILNGRISVRDEKPPQLVVNRVLPIADMQDADVAQAARQAAAQAHTVYLRIEDSAQSSARKVFPVLKMFPGKAKAVVYYADSGARMGGKCAIDERMLREMRELLGEKNVIVK
mgnify:CR=1 FL=1